VALILDPDTPLGPFRTEDVPGVVDLAYLDTDSDTAVDWDLFTALDAALVTPAGTVVTLPDPVPGGTVVSIDLDPSPFDIRGLYQLTIRGITDMAPDPDTVVLTEPAYVVVEGADGWLTLEWARMLWPDARTIPDVSLWLVLESARIACTAYAPALPVPEVGAEAVIPANYVQAQVAQARAIWNLMQTSPQSDLIGYDQTAVRVYPLDYNIRQLLRPKSGKPVLW
jgi:hypothetical protein